MKKSPKQVLAENIRSLRAGKKWSQTELSRHSGIPQTTISAIERAVFNPGIDLLDGLSKALNVPPWALLFTDYDPNLFAKTKVKDLIDKYITLPEISRQEVMHVAEREQRYSSR